jgi:hypothetical protein
VLSKEEFKMAVEKMHFVSMTQLCRMYWINIQM